MGKRSVFALLAMITVLWQGGWPRPGRETMPDQERRSPREGLRGYWAWAIPVTMVVLALGAAFVVETLHDRSQERHQAQTALKELEEEALHQLFAQEEALVQRAVSQELKEEVVEGRRETAELLEELERSDPDADGLNTIRGTLASLQTAVEEEFRLI